MGMSPKFRSDNSDSPKIGIIQAGKSDWTILERVTFALRELDDERDLAWLAKKAEIPPSTFYDNLKKGSIVKTDVALKVASTLNVSLDWLLTGHDSSPDNRTGSSKASDLGLTMIPETDISYSLGGGMVVEDYAETRMVPFRSDWLSRLTRGGPADVFLTRGQGDSMMPTILDDDDVLVNRADRAIRHQDRIWAVGYGDLGMIKRVRRLPSGMFQLNSDNPAVSPIEATEDELFIVGRVIWIGRRV